MIEKKQKNTKNKNNLRLSFDIYQHNSQKTKKKVRCFNKLQHILLPNNWWWILNAPFPAWFNASTLYKATSLSIYYIPYYAYANATMLNQFSLLICNVCCEKLTWFEMKTFLIWFLLISLSAWVSFSEEKTTFSRKSTGAEVWFIPTTKSDILIIKSQ